MIRGAYALAIIDAKNPEILYATKLSSPLVIGVGSSENFYSDPSALVGKTKNVIYLSDGEIAKISQNNISITNLEKQETPFEVVRLEWDLEQAQKGGLSTFPCSRKFLKDQRLSVQLSEVG